MRKLITLATTAAIAINAVTPAFATSLPSWEEVIAKAANNQGGWVRGKHTDAVFKPLNGADGFLFGNVLADDTPLPRVTDVRKVLDAAKQGEKPIIVASQEWLLPSNPMLCEIARQVKMDCAEFTRLFYMHMQKNDDGTYVGDDKAYEGLHEIQAELVATLEAMELVDTSEDPAVTQLKATLKSLELADSETHAATIELLKGTIADMESAFKWDLEAINAKLSDLDTLHKELQDKHDAEVKAHNAEIEAHKQTIQDHIDELAGYRNSLKDAGVEYDESLQTMINALVSMRNNLQKDYDVYTKGYEDYATAADVWQKSQELALTYDGTEYTNAKAIYDAGVASVDKVHTVTVNGTEYIVGSDKTITVEEDQIIYNITYVDKTEYINEGVVVDQTTYINEGVVVDKTEYINEGVTVDKTVYINEGVTVDLTKYINEGVVVDQTTYINEGVVVDLTEYINKDKVVDLTTYINAGVTVDLTEYVNNGVVVDIETFDTYQEGFDDGVASVDITTDNAAAIAAHMETVTVFDSDLHYTSEEVVELLDDADVKSVTIDKYGVINVNYGDGTFDQWVKGDKSYNSGHWKGANHAVDKLNGGNSVVELTKNDEGSYVYTINYAGEEHVHLAAALDYAFGQGEASVSFTSGDYTVSSDDELTTAISTAVGTVTYQEDTKVNSIYGFDPDTKELLTSGDIKPQIQVTLTNGKKLIFGVGFAYTAGANSVGLAENPNWALSLIDGDYNIGQNWQYKKSGKMDIYLSNGKTVEINVARFAEYVKENLGKDVNVTSTSYDDFTQKITVNVSDGGNFTDSYEIDVSEAYKAGVDSVSFSFTINSTKYTVDENSDILTVFNAAKDVALSQAIAELPSGQGYAENQAGIVAALKDFKTILNSAPGSFEVSGNTFTGVTGYADGDGGLALDTNGDGAFNESEFLNVVTDSLSSELGNIVMAEIVDAIEAAYHEGYDDGYDEGYTNGYNDGWNDAISQLN